MTSYVTKAMNDEYERRMREHSLFIGDREHHKELLDLNLIVTMDDKTFDETPQWFLDFMQKNMEKYGLRTVQAS